MALQFRKTWRLLVLASVVAVYAPTSTASDRISELTRTFPTVPVIVGLRLPTYQPEGRLTKLGRDQQRAAIRNTIADFRSRYERGDRKVADSIAIPFVYLTISDQDLIALRADPAISSIEADAIGEVSLSQSVGIVGAATNGRFGLAGLDGSGKVIVILDTGVERTHPFLRYAEPRGAFQPEACRSFTGSIAGQDYFGLCPGANTDTSDAAGSGAPCNLAEEFDNHVPFCSHGTHVAGIATGNGSMPLAGGVAREARVISIQIMSRLIESGVTSPRFAKSSLVRALDLAILMADAYDIAAVNISANGRPVDGDISATSCDTDNLATKDAVAGLRSKGIPAVVSSGNTSDPTRLLYPACVTGVVSVGASTKGDAVYQLSNGGTRLTLLAPGTGLSPVAPPEPFERIQSSIVGGAYGHIAGTSMAAAHVSGAFAILKQRGEEPTEAGLEELRTDITLNGPLIADDRPGGIAKPRLALTAAADFRPTQPRPAHASWQGGAVMRVSWAASTGGTIESYELSWRTNPSGAWAPLADVTGALSFDHSQKMLLPGSVLFYRVVAVASSGRRSAPAHAIGVVQTFTDLPVVAGSTTIRAIHLTQLRTAVNSVRTACGLPTKAWTDTTVAPGITAIRTVHIQELRDALDAPLVQLHLPTLAQTAPDNPLVPGVTPIKAAHINTIFTLLR